MRRPLLGKELHDFFEKRGLRVKKVEEKDLEAVDDLCVDVHFEVGLHNLKLYHKHSPDSWYIVTDSNGQVLVFDAKNNLSNGTQYAYVITTRESFRGKGLTGPFAPDFQYSAIVASSTQDTLQRYNLHGQYFLEKRHGMYGFCSRRQFEALILPTVPGVVIERLQANSMEQLLKYDQQISQLDRKEFTKQWCMPDNPDYGGTVLARDETSGKCLGYATVRLFSNYYGIQPVYADNDQVATALMIAACKLYLQDDVNLYMPLMASKRAALQFCYQLGMTITGTEFRNCSPMALAYAKSIPVQKAYSVHEYYPV